MSSGRALSAVKSGRRGGGVSLDDPPQAGSNELNKLVTPRRHRTRLDAWGRMRD